MTNSSIDLFSITSLSYAHNSSQIFLLCTVHTCPAAEHTLVPRRRDISEGAGMPVGFASVVHETSHTTGWKELLTSSMCKCKPKLQCGGLV